MILLGFGGNLPFGVQDVATTLRAAFASIPDYGIKIKNISPFYSSAPVPVSDQPRFLNGVAEIETDLSPEKLLAALIHIEEKFGRARSVKNAARTLDLDILDFKGIAFSDDKLSLPHPHIEARAFVLLPLRDVAPGWKHPVTGRTVHELLDALSAAEKAAVIRQQG